MGRPKTGRTPIRTVRIPDPIWNAAAALAEARGESVSTVIRRGLLEYVEGKPRSRKRPTVPGSPPRSSDPGGRIAAQERRGAP